MFCCVTNSPQASKVSRNICFFLMQVCFLCSLRNHLRGSISILLPQSQEKETHFIQCLFLEAIQVTSAHLPSTNSSHMATPNLKEDWRGAFSMCPEEELQNAYQGGYRQLLWFQQGSEMCISIDKGKGNIRAGWGNSWEVAAVCVQALRQEAPQPV